MSTRHFPLRTVIFNDHKDLAQLIDIYVQLVQLERTSATSDKHINTREGLKESIKYKETREGRMSCKIKGGG